MFNDGRRIEKESVIEGNLCILGAGAAGLAIAMEFAGTKDKIILVESGGLEFDQKTQSLYDGEDDIGLGDMRTRFFGGSTNCWGGRCAPLNSSDFKVKEWVPHSGWPITRDTLDPFYERACDLLELGPYKQFSSKDWDKNLFAGQFFRPFKSPDSKIAGVPFTHSPEPILRLGPRFQKALKQTSNINVFLNSNVIALNATADGNQIKDVRIQTLDGNIFTVQAKKYVLALGGLENPRLLLASNAVEPNGIGNRNDLVGRYFMTHPITPGGKIMYSTEQFCFEKELYTYPENILFFKISDKVQKEERILNEGLDLWRIIPEAETAFRQFRRDLFRGQFSLNMMGKQLLQMSKDIGGVAHAAACHIQFDRRPHRLWYYKMQAESVPNPENRVMLGDGKDALGMKKLRVTRTMSALGKRSYLRTREIFAAEVMRYGLGRVKLDEVYKDSELFSDGDPQRLVFGHDMGTTKMADSPKNGVVDQNCRVHGVNNLYIAGSSVFPTSGFVNPTLTIIALSLRIADHIKSAG